MKSKFSIVVCAFVISLCMSAVSVNTKEKNSGFAPTIYLSFDLPDQWTSIYMKANGIQLHVIRTHGEKPVMVLAHGGFSHGLKCWSELANVFQNQYDVIMYDARGHGDTQRTGKKYTLQDHANDLSGLIQTLQLKKPIMIGHSMGSYTTMMTAAKYPNLPKAVVLIDPLLRMVPSKEDQEGIREFKKMAGSVKKDYQTLFAQKSELVNHLDIHALPVIDDISRLRLEDFENYFQKITCPIFIICADSSIEKKEKEKRFVKKFSHIEMIHIPGAGHVVHRDCPEETTKVILDFLKKVAQ